MVIPSFAVGRTQEMLYFLRKIKEDNLLPEFPGFEVFVDKMCIRDRLRDGNLRVYMNR